MNKYLKCILLLFTVVAILIVFFGCNYNETSINDSPTNINKPEYTNSISKRSIFEGESLNHNIKDLKPIDIKRNDNIWIIDGKDYIQQEDEYPLIAMKSQWKINLNEFTPFGIDKDSTIIFIQKNNYDTDVLIAKKDDKYYFLVSSNDVLNPQNYTIDDFEQKSSQPNIGTQQIVSLWETHINTTIHTFVVVTDKIPSTVTLSLKKVPGLIYEFYYLEYGGEYHTSIPWGMEDKIKTGDGSQKTGDGSLS